MEIAAKIITILVGPLTAALIAKVFLDVSDEAAIIGFLVGLLLSVLLHLT